MVDFVAGLLQALEKRHIVTLATIVGPDALPPALLGRKLLLLSNGTVDGGLGAPSLDSRVMEDCRRAMAAPPFARTVAYVLDNDESGVLGLELGVETEVFVEVMQPPETLLIVGAGHIAQPLSRIGKMLGFEVAVIDDRWSFANRERFPEADQVIAGYYAQELAKFTITPSTYVVLVTRGHTHDEESLRQIVDSPAAYIGMIGSRRRVGAVLRHMVEEGIPKELVDRVCSPIGLDIGAETPEEIAVSIIAEITNARRRGARHPASMSNSTKVSAKR